MDMTSTARDAAAPWRDKIMQAWQKQVGSIVETGQLLIAAKKALEHGQYQRMIAAELPFKKRTAQMLMQIAEHPTLTKAQHVAVLPSSWGTLYELAQIPPKLLEDLIKQKRIHPKLERSEVDALRGKKKKEKAKPGDSCHKSIDRYIGTITKKAKEGLSDLEYAAIASDVREAGKRLAGMMVNLKDLTKKDAPHGTPRKSRKRKEEDWSDRDFDDHIFHVETCATSIAAEAENFGLELAKIDHKRINIEAVNSMIGVLLKSIEMIRRSIDVLRPLQQSAGEGKQGDDKSHLKVVQ